jgi:hypothetical protein
MERKKPCGVQTRISYRDYDGTVNIFFIEWEVKMDLER